MNDRITRPKFVPKGYELTLDHDPFTGDAVAWYWEGLPTETAQLAAYVTITHDEIETPSKSIHIDLESGEYTLDELATNIRALADLYKKARHDFSTPDPRTANQ